MNIIERLSYDLLGSNNTPRVKSLLKRGKIIYQTSGSPSCWSDWFRILGIEDLKTIYADHDNRLGWGYDGIRFAIDK